MIYYNQNDYSNVKYDRPSTTKIETIETSGCGVVSMCIVVNNLVSKEMYSVAKMAEFSLKNGARDDSGTNLITLLKAFCNSNKEFTYSTTNDINKLVAHLKAGGKAICNQGDAYNVFSTGGHFVVAYGMSGNNVEIVDPKMYSGKYDAYCRPQRIVQKTANGCIVAPSQLVKATADRSPAFYLISYKPKEEKKMPKKYGNAAMTSAQNVYADSDLTVKVGSVSKAERVNQLGTGETNPIIAYKTANGYKVGFVKKGTVKKD